ncbi:Lrp/AsnC family transcriptional regulator [Microbacterium esteraromaticum]|uniref:Lrp/AsnC family transcriptional regulator n=1 Tax=Microbacterium esteraromaticum TaxID=57043 RepID=UPI0015CE351E|nr:Lrp/AsnC family transcriptional regulator [Microbacterium esteraromaticum]MCA1307096.1 Lrp/AsnC family transcriptional regulator [Microbacterium esteraromaticum]
MNDLKADDSDRLIAAALQVNGRASWGEIGRALDLPERTVARRGQRLLDSGLVRVSTYVDPARVLHARAVLFRITTQPRALWSVARSLARRPDASSVSVLEGSSDVTGMLLPRDDAAIRELLFTDFRELRGVESIHVTTVLKFFRSGHDWRVDILSDEQVRMLDPGPSGPLDPGDSLSPDEHALIELLLRDGRMPVAQLARDVGLNVTTTRRRMESLQRRGLMHPRTEVLPSLFGLGLEALVWFRVPMADMEAVGSALATAPEVKFIVATTGTSQLLLNVLVQDEAEFYEFLTGPTIAQHEGLEVVDSLVVIAPVLRGSLMVDTLIDADEEPLTGAIRI